MKKGLKRVARLFLVTLGVCCLLEAWFRATDGIDERGHVQWELGSPATAALGVALLGLAWTLRDSGDRSDAH